MAAPPATHTALSVVTIALTVVTVTLISVLWLAGGRHEQTTLEMRTDSTSPSGTSAPATAAEPVPVPVPATDAAPAGPSPGSAAAPPQVVCLNSVDPTCGPFRWSGPLPANQPMEITIEVTPAQPVPGEEVTVHVVAVDPDAEVTTNCGSHSFDDPFSQEPQIGYACTISRGSERFGPWTPPSATRGRIEASFRHVFTEPGTFGFSFEARSGDPTNPGDTTVHPFASTGRSTVAITVAASS